MATLDVDDLHEIERAVDRALKSRDDRLDDHAIALFGEDGRGGLVSELAEVRGFARIGMAVSGLVLGIAGFLGITLTRHNP